MFGLLTEIINPKLILKVLPDIVSCEPPPTGLFDTPAISTDGMTKVPPMVPSTITTIMIEIIMNQTIPAAQAGRQHAQHKHRKQPFLFFMRLSFFSLLLFSVFFLKGNI
jgi:hypothetical protein